MTDPTAASAALEALAAVTAALPAAEDRPGQREMTELVAASIERGRHLVVQAGTGTGKTHISVAIARATSSEVVPNWRVHRRVPCSS